MSVQSFKELPALINYADGIIHGYDTVTIDLFDTIFIRRMHDPDMVKPAVARYIAKKAKFLGYQHTWQEVQLLRDRFEKEQRKITGQSYDDQEACYPDYMGRLLQEIFNNRPVDEILKEVTAYELEIEKRIIVPRTNLVEWIKKLYHHDKTILIVSDIYLPAVHLKNLVDHFGLLNFVRDVVSSADTFLAKASGNAFPMLAEKYKLDPERWLHVGDNPISDGLRPTENGIKALLIEDQSEHRRKRIAKIYAGLASVRPFWKGRLIQQLTLPLEAENQSRSGLYIEGYSFFAPLMGAFVQGISEELDKHNISSIYFFAREGLTFKKFWDKAIPMMRPKETLPDSHYLYVSRMALAGASCAYGGIPQTKADIAFFPPGNRDMRDFCRVFSLDIHQLVPIMKKYGIKEDSPVSPIHSHEADTTGAPKNYNYRFRLLIEDPDFQENIKKQTKPKNDALQRYLEKEQFFKYPKVALVDIGWMGTIQRFLYDAIKHREDKPKFHGYLLAASRGVPYPTIEGNQVKGIIYDREHFDFAASTIMYNRDLFEEACRAPHPTMAGYDLSQGEVKLIFRSRDDAIGIAEEEQDRYFSALQEGIIDAAPFYGAALSMMGFTYKDLMPWVRYLLVSKMAFPKTNEFRMLKHKAHVDDIHGNANIPKALQKLQTHLWNEPINIMKWNPFIRLWYYIKKGRPT